MTNFEKYKDELARIAFIGKAAFTHDGVVLCVDTNCRDCYFSDRNLDSRLWKSCASRRVEWAEAEYKESIKLKECERKFCEMIEEGWLESEVEDEDKAE